MADQNPRLAEITEQVNYELERFGRLSGTTADSLRDAQVGVEGFSAAMRKAPGQVADAAGKMAKAMYDGQKGASAFNSSIDSMAGAAQSATTMLMAIIPGGVAVKVALMALGKAIGFAAETLKQVNIQGDALYKGFQDLAKSGSVAAGGTTQLGQDIYKLGIGFQDLDKYLGLVNESSQDLALFGRTVFEGSADFANLRQTMKPMRAEFERLGLNAEQQNEAVMGYIRLQTRLGNASRLQERGYADTAEAARKYIMEQDALTKVTGISRKEQEKAMEEAMRNQRFAATLDQLVAEGRTEEAENLRVMVQASGQLGPQFQKGMTDLASGFANTEEARQVQLATQGDALKQFDMVKQGLIKAPGEIDRAQQSIYNNVAAFNKNMQPLAAAGAYDKTFGSYAEQRQAQELKGEKFAAAMAKSREETAKQMAGTDDRLAAQSNTVVNQQDAMLESQKLMDRAITGAAQASEFASEKLAKLARMANDTADALGGVNDALGGVKTESKGFWGQVLKFMGIDTTPREKTEKEQQLAAAEEAAKQAAERAAAERAVTAEAKKQAEAALEAERKSLKEAQSQSDRAKAQLQGVGTQAGVNFDVQRLQRQERAATAKVDSAGTDQERKKAQEDAERIRLRLSEAMAEQRRLQGIVAEQARIAEAAKAAVAQREAAAAEARKKDANAKATEDKATRDSLRAQSRAGMGGGERLTAEEALKASAPRQEREKDTAALGKINETLTRQRENLKANTDQLAKLDKTRDKATIESLERVNETITKRTKELETEAEALKEKIKKNQPKPAPSAPRPPGAASSSGAGGGAGGGAAPGGTSTAAPATVPVGPTASPAGGGGAAPAGGGTTSTAPGGAGGPQADQLVQMGNEIRIGNQIRKGGSIAWRTNNPGNVSYGELAKKFGAIGTWKNPRGDAQQRSTGIAIMPTEEAGINLKKDLWRRPLYTKLTIDAAIQQWAEGAKKFGYGSNYARAMATAAGATLDTVVGTLTDRQLQSMVVKQREFEGWKTGQVVSAADGGMFSGPKSGYPATLHGDEAVIPLKNGEVPVNIDNKNADLLHKEVRNLTANVIRLTQKDVMAPGGIGPTMGGHNEYTGYSMGPMTTDIAMLEKIAGKLGAYDKATQTITDPKLWKDILKSGMLMNYDFGMTQVGTKDLSSRAGAESVADAIASRIKELINNRQDSTEAIAQTRTEFADMMKTFYTDIFTKLQDELRKENPLDSEMLAVLKDISQTNAAAAGSSEKMLRHARN